MDANPFSSWTGSQGPLASLSQCHSKLVMTRLEGTTMRFSAMTCRNASHPMLIEMSYSPLFFEYSLFFDLGCEHVLRDEWVWEGVQTWTPSFVIWQKLQLRHHWSYSGKQGVDQEQGFWTSTHNTRQCLHNMHMTTVHGVCQIPWLFWQPALQRTFPCKWSRNGS